MLSSSAASRPGARRPRGPVVAPRRPPAPPAFAPRASATSRTRRPENAPGDLFVDSSCIDCDACRWLAPASFARLGAQSAVHAQPRSDAERLAAAQALLCCPTASIHLAPSREATALRERAAATFPLPLGGRDDTFFLGFTSPKSFGALSWLLRRPDREGGNVMVDSPRFAPHLAAAVEALGGARAILLTHKDDVADSALWAQRLGALRVMHEADNPPLGVEAVLSGPGPWRLPGEGDGSAVTLLGVPGHTRGCVALLHTPADGDGTLFSGDHLGGTAGGGLSAFLDFNWFSTRRQLQARGYNTDGETESERERPGASE